MAKEKQFRDGKKRRKKKKKKVSLSARAGRFFRSLNHRQLYSEDSFLTWLRARETGIRPGELVENEVISGDEECILEEINLDVDLGLVKSREQREKNQKIAAKVGHLIP